MFSAFICRPNSREGDWAVGVAVRPIDPINEKIWGIYVCTCHVWMHGLTPEHDTSAGVLSQDSFPPKGQSGARLRPRKTIIF